MTRRKREGANVTFDPAVASNHFDGLEVSPRPYCSAAFKAAVERAQQSQAEKEPSLFRIYQQPLSVFHDNAANHIADFFSMV